MDDGERLMAIKKHYDKTWEVMAKDLDVKATQSFQDVRSGKSRMSRSLIERILNKYPEINAEWLVTGRGTMLCNTTSQLASVAVLFPGTTHTQRVEVATDCYPQGATLALRKIEEPALLLCGEDYVFRTVEFCRVRRLLDRDESGGFLLASSQSSRATLVAADELLDVYEILGYWVRRTAEVE